MLDWPLTAGYCLEMWQQQQQQQHALALMWN